MSAKSIFRTSCRWLAVGAGVAAASYAAVVGYAWLCYGDVRPAARPEEQDALLDQFMPKYEVAERHHIQVDAPADITFDAAARMDLQQSSIVRASSRHANRSCAVTQRGRWNGPRLSSRCRTSAGACWPKSPIERSSWAP